MKINWPTATVVVATLALIGFALHATTGADQPTILAVVGAVGAVVAGLLGSVFRGPPGAGARVGGGVAITALSLALTGCGGASGLQLKPAFVTACGAARVACGLVQTACAFAPPVDAEPVAATSGDEGEATP